jgi:hypothetical protein
MRRASALLCALLASSLAQAADERLVLHGAVDVVGVVSSSPLDSWLNGGEGKLRFDNERSGVHFDRAFLDASLRITDTVSARGVINAQDGVSRVVDLTEAYLEWRPIPRSSWRVRTRAGVFYPRISLENTDYGWSSPYALSASAINTWIGEELRAVGGELRVAHDVPLFGLTTTVSIEGAFFYANDQSALLLAARGWAIHDRQTGIFSSVRLPPVEAIESWEFEAPKSSSAAPFRELDGHPGYYAGVEWRLGRRALLRYLHYDNHVNPDLEGGLDYAWQLWFDHVAAQVDLPLGVGLLGQWMSGATRSGPDLGPWRVYDIDFTAWYLLLTRAFGRHRLTVRYDHFDSTPVNDPDNYVNTDRGHGLAFSYLCELNRHLRLGAEYLVVRTRHCSVVGNCAWVSVFGLPQDVREATAQAALRWRF